MNIAFVTLHTPSIQHYACKTIPIMKEYCKKNNYTFIEYTTSLDPTKYIAWSKIPAIITTLTTNKYDWVFWADADSCPLQHSTRLEEFIDTDYDIIIDTQPKLIEDKQGVIYESYANTGLWFIKNSEWSLEFLNNLYDSSLYTKWHLGVNPYHEQTALSLSYNSNELLSKSHIKHLEPYTMYSRTGHDKFFIHPYGSEFKCLLQTISGFVK